MLRLRFFVRCEHADISNDIQSTAVSVKLTENERVFYFSSITGKYLSTKNIIRKLRERFESSERAVYLSPHFLSSKMQGVMKNN